MPLNFLVFCTDQMQSACLGCNGHPMVRTPNVNALAAGGVTFRRAYCNNSVCMPSRATMVTGLTPRGHGVLTNGNSLPEDVPTVTGALVQAGYRTHAVGKLHLQPFGGMGRSEDFFSWEEGAAWNSGRTTELPSPYYGFQSVDLCDGHVNYAFGHYRRWLEEQRPGAMEAYQKASAHHATEHAWRFDLPEELHYNHWIADRTIDFLGRADEQPFFLFCSFPDPHFPFAACRPYCEMYDPADVPLPATWGRREDAAEFLRAHRRAGKWAEPIAEDDLREVIAQTYGMISHVDANIGRVLEALRSAGHAEDTVVLLMADHGEYLGAHNLLTKGVWPIEPLVRVPYVWRVPGAPHPRPVVDDPVSLLDFVPTVADLAGLPAGWHDTRGFAHKRLPLPGRSLRPYFQTEAVESTAALLEYDEDFHAGSPLTRMRGLVLGDWKITCWAGFEEGWLVHLGDDPHETVNRWDDPAVATVKADLLARLVQRLAASDRWDTRRICGA